MESKSETLCIDNSSKENDKIFYMESVLPYFYKIFKDLAARGVDKTGVAIEKVTF